MAKVVLKFVASKALVKQTNKQTKVNNNIAICKACFREVKV